MVMRSMEQLNEDDDNDKVCFYKSKYSIVE